MAEEMCWIKLGLHHELLGQLFQEVSSVLVQVPACGPRLPLQRRFCPVRFSPKRPSLQSRTWLRSRQGFKKTYINLAYSIYYKSKAKLR